MEAVQGKCAGSSDEEVGAFVFTLSPGLPPSQLFSQRASHPGRRPPDHPGHPRGEGARWEGEVRGVRGGEGGEGGETA
jgi:hypothetical protein